MTPTEKARRSDALYYETVSVTRRVLCDAIANREADIDDLRKENARLRESVKRLMTQRDERLARAEADNAKLRGLLEAVLQCAGETKRDKGCDACPMYNGPWRNDGAWCLLRPTLREMGVDE